MAFAVGILALAVFLSGTVTGVLIMVVIGIRRGDRARHLADEPDTSLDGVTRCLLGVGVRTSGIAGDNRTKGA